VREIRVYGDKLLIDNLKVRARTGVGKIYF